MKRSERDFNIAQKEVSDLQKQVMSSASALFFVRLLLISTSFYCG